MTVQETKANGPDGRKDSRSGVILQWLRVLLPVLVSWPAVGLVVALLFREPLGGVIERFAQSEQGKAELGPLKIELGAPVLPPRYRLQAGQPPAQRVDLAETIGPIGDTGPEGTTVGFAVAYAVQSAAATGGQQGLRVSARGIYVLAKRFDEFPGEEYEGATLLGALKAATTVGVYRAEDWPYEAKVPPADLSAPVLKLREFTPTDSVPLILDALRGGKVVVASLMVTRDFDTPSPDGRVILKLPLRELGLKTMTIVGYDPDSAEFKLANDWGSGWGAGGFAFIKDTDLARVLENGYTVTL